MHALFCTKKESENDSDVFDDEFDYDEDSGSDYDWDEPGDDEDQVWLVWVVLRRVAIEYVQ